MSAANAALRITSAAAAFGNIRPEDHPISPRERKLRFEASASPMPLTSLSEPWRHRKLGYRCSTRPSSASIAPSRIGGPLVLSGNVAEGSRRTRASRRGESRALNSSLSARRARATSIPRKGQRPSPTAWTRKPRPTDAGGLTWSARALGARWSFALAPLRRPARLRG